MVGQRVQQEDNLQGWGVEEQEEDDKEVQEEVQEVDRWLRR